MIGPISPGGATDTELAALVGRPGVKRVIEGGPFVPPTEFFQFLINGMYMLVIPGMTAADVAVGLSMAPGIGALAFGGGLRIWATGFDDIEIDDEGVTEQLAGIGLTAGIYPPIELPTGIFAENLELRKEIANVGALTGLPPLVEGDVLEDVWAPFDFSGGSFSIIIGVNGVDTAYVLDEATLVMMGMNPTAINALDLANALQNLVNAALEEPIAIFVRSFGQMGRMAISGTALGYDQFIYINAIETTAGIPKFGLRALMMANGVGRQELWQRLFDLKAKDQTIIDRLDAAGVPQLPAQ